MCVVHLGADLDWQDEINGEREGAPSAMRRVSELPWVTSMAQIGLRGSGTAKSRDVRDALAFGSVLIRAEELHEAGVPATTVHPPARGRSVRAPSWRGDRRRDRQYSPSSRSTMALAAAQS